MKMNYKKFIIFAFFIVLSLSSVACRKNNDKQIGENEDKKKIKIGCTEVSEISLKAAEQDMKEMGYDVEFVIFDSNILPIKSVNDGSVDISFGQHLKFAQKFNEENNGDLDMVEPYTYYTGIGLYSEKHSKLEDLPNGAKISIMNDAMNMDKGLRMLEDAGLIKLDDEKKGTYSLMDIKENPKNFEIIDMEQAQTVRSLEDLDGSIVFFTHMLNVGKDFE